MPTCIRVLVSLENDSLNFDLFEWLSKPWIANLIQLFTIPAFVFAWLAHRSSVKNYEQARAAELTSLRIQAKAGLGEAQRSLLALQTSAQASRAEWANHERKQGMLLGPIRDGYAQSPNPLTLGQGHAILRKLEQSFANVESMKPTELETLMQDARAASIQILSLAGEFQGPPNYSR